QFQLIPVQLHVLTQGLGVEAGVEEHRPGEFGHIAGEDVGGLTAQDAPALGRQVDEQTRFEAVVVDAHVRAFEDLLTRPAEDDRALPEVGQGLVPVRSRKSATAMRSAPSVVMSVGKPASARSMRTRTFDGEANGSTWTRSMKTVTGPN